jgi:capsular polysaccharide transport system permease protein
MKTRFGQYRLSYAWALLEPIAAVSVLAFIWTVLRQRDLGGVPVIPFLVTGMVPFLFFSHAVNSSLNAINANMGLFNYRQVRPFDTLVSRLVLEGLISLAVYCVMLFGTWWLFDEHTWPNDILLLIFISLLLFLFIAGLAMISSVVGTLYPEPAKLIPIMMRPLFFISGVIFPLSMLPEQFLPYLLWNPLLHAIEISHLAFFESFSSPHVSLEYFFFCSVISLAFGLMCLRVSWQRMLST